MPRPLSYACGKETRARFSTSAPTVFVVRNRPAPSRCHHYAPRSGLGLYRNLLRIQRAAFGSRRARTGKWSARSRFGAKIEIAPSSLFHSGQSLTQAASSLCPSQTTALVPCTYECSAIRYSLVFLQGVPCSSTASDSKGKGRTLVRAPLQMYCVPYYGVLLVVGGAQHIGVLLEVSIENLQLFDAPRRGRALQCAYFCKGIVWGCIGASAVDTICS